MSPGFDAVPFRLVNVGRERRCVGDRQAVWIFGYASVICASPFCGAGVLLAHALLR